jgi:hypothetical protein
MRPAEYRNAHHEIPAGCLRECNDDLGVISHHAGLGTAVPSFGNEQIACLKPSLH